MTNPKYATMPAKEPAKVTVHIPGGFFAEYAGDAEKGNVSRLTFYPDAGAAGYCGPAAELYDYDDRFDDELAGLDVEDTDGAFWRAMQAALEYVVVYDIDGNAEPVKESLVPILWAE